MSVEERLQELAEMFDGLTAEIVVEDASNPDSPLHQYFCWDDTRAAFAYRCEQARGLIRRFNITIDKPNGDAIEVRRFQFVESVNRYVPTKQVLERQEYMNDVLQRAANELRTFRIKYGKLVDVDKLVRQVFDLDVTV
jgi:hypothetical protein